jgi:hypothetical protein
MIEIIRGKAGDLLIIYRHEAELPSVVSFTTPPEVKSPKKGKTQAM